jgi:hypothetical protein
MYRFRARALGGVFAPDFTVCMKEGGPTICPSEYVKEFSGYQRRPGYLGDLSDTWFDPASGPSVNRYYVPAENTSDADTPYRSGVVFRRTIY